VAHARRFRGLTIAIAQVRFIRRLRRLTAQKVKLGSEREGSRVLETNDRDLRIYGLCWKVLSPASRALGSSVNRHPSAEALGYFHVVRSADDKTHYPDFLGKAD